MNSGLFDKSFLTLGDAPRLACVRLACVVVDNGAGRDSVAKVVNSGTALWINIINFYDHFVLN